MGYVVGRQYVTVTEDVYPPCGLVDVGQTFTCAFVDFDGDCWVDCDYNGTFGRWCVATRRELEMGDVREVAV